MLLSFSVHFLQWSNSSSRGETRNGTLDLAGGVTICGDFPRASLDTSRSATYFARLLASPSQESQAAFASDKIS